MGDTAQSGKLTGMPRRSTNSGEKIHRPELPKFSVTIITVSLSTRP